MASPRQGKHGRVRRQRGDTSVRRMREAARRVSRSDLYSDHHLKSEYHTNPKVYAWFQKRHKQQLAGLGEDGIYRKGKHRWKVPYGVRLCLRRPLVANQMIRDDNWSVLWRSPKTGRRLRKHFHSPYAAIDFIATKAQYVDKQASLISRMGYDIPTKLRGKIPAPHKWCPLCMNARRFRRVYPEQEFLANRKEWQEDKQRYEYRERRVFLTACEVCGCTNRDWHYRRSNQPWELRKFKRGVRRAKPIHRTKSKVLSRARTVHRARARRTGS